MKYKKKLANLAARIKYWESFKIKSGKNQEVKRNE